MRPWRSGCRHLLRSRRATRRRVPKSGGGLEPFCAVWYTATWERNQSRISPRGALARRWLGSGDRRWTDRSSGDRWSGLQRLRLWTRIRLLRWLPRLRLLRRWVCPGVLRRIHNLRPGLLRSKISECHPSRLRILRRPAICPRPSSLLVIAGRERLAPSIEKGRSFGCGLFSWTPR
jgi:hypothetical protein